MSKAPKGSKQASRWGSLLQQAVAGVESRLDTILADGDEQPAPAVNVNSKTLESLESKERSHSTTPAGTRANSLSRSASNSRMNGRLQERLAKAVVKNGSTRRPDSPASTSEFPSRGADSPRTSADIKTSDTGTEPTHQVLASAAVLGGENSSETDENWDQDSYPGHATTLPVSTSDLLILAGPSAETRSGDSFLHPPATAPQGIAPNDVHTSSTTVVERTSKAQRSTQEYEAMLSQMQSDYEVSETRRQEETHSFMERIDALQTKLQYLTKEALETAKSALATAPAESLDRRLAEKDQQIALLMEEGEKLAITELRHMNIIKSLRSSILGDQKHSAGVTLRLENAEHEIQNAKERARRAEDSEQQELESLVRVENENELLKAELDSQRAIVAALSFQLTQGPPKASVAESAAQTDALEGERAISARLRDDLSKTRIEKELSEEKLRSEIRRITKEAERETERYRATETELRREQYVLENRLEVLHTRAEEVTTGAVSDAQTKLLRQVEVLQTQHSIALENWQGVEGSLLHRIKSLEEERDEIAKKEADLRRRTRDLKLKLARASEELDTALDKLNSLDRQFAEQSKELNTIQERLRLSEAALAEAKADFTRDRASWEVALTARIEDEKNKWNQESNQTSSTAASQFRIRSPGSYTRKGSSADFFSPQAGRPNAQTDSMNVSISVADRTISSHELSQPLRTPDVGIPYRQDSLPFTTQQSISSTVPPTPSVQISDQDDLFEGSGTPASAQRTINDMISVSTAGAGPSVQLVERMSATVRRLESEKEAFKDELARLSYQRDEAREQVVSLMREVEQKRAADTKIQRLEREICQVNERYHTTLEMLGEKSELVEELKADVADVKKIYRELVDNTMR